MSRRREHRNRRRVDDAKKVKRQGVDKQRPDQENGDQELLTLRRRPLKQQAWLELGRRSIHGGGGVVASATELMPCSSAAFDTAMTVSYGVDRSAFIIIERFSRLAASSNGPSCSRLIFWSRK